MFEFGKDLLFIFDNIYDPITKIDGWLLNFYFSFINTINNTEKLIKNIIFNQLLIIDDEILRTN